MKKTADSYLVKKIVYSLFNVAAIILIVYSLSFASSGGAAPEHITGAMVKDLVLKVINFSILLFILVYFIKKPFKNFLSSRRSTVEDAISEADTGLQDAESEYKDADENIKRLNDEVRKITDSIRSEGEAERDKIIERAEDEAQKIKKQADSAVERELSTIRKKIKEETIRQAIKAAEKIIIDSIKPDDQERFVKIITDEISSFDNINVFLHGASDALIYSAMDVNESDLNKITASLKKATGKEIGIEIKKDTSIGGGIVAKVGNLVFDASIKTQLKKMTENLEKEVG